MAQHTLFFFFPLWLWLGKDSLLHSARHHLSSTCPDLQMPRSRQARLQISCFPTLMYSQRLLLSHLFKPKKRYTSSQGPHFGYHLICSFYEQEYIFSPTHTHTLSLSSLRHASTRSLCHTLSLYQPRHFLLTHAPSSAECYIYKHAKMPSLYDNHFHGFIRSIRSKSKSEASHHRERRPSECSSEARSSCDSSRPSISSRSEYSIEWDPLRAHPPLAVSRAPTFDEVVYSHDQPPSPTRQTLHELGASPSAHNLKSGSAQEISATLGGARESSVDFEFGFIPPAMLASELRMRRHQPQLVLSAQAAGAQSYDSGIDNGADVSPTDTSSGSGSVTSRARPAGLDDAEYFMKRGNWKRRGIVFAAPTQIEALEEECFDFDASI
jgi:hypothetical protein